MKSIGRKTVVLLLIALLAVTTLTVNIGAEDDGVITETLDIANARMNLSGPGYYWANRFDQLTLSGLNLYTAEPFGLRLPLSLKAATISTLTNTVLPVPGLLFSRAQAHCISARVK